MARCTLPLLDAVVVHVLATCDAVCDVGDGRVEFVLANAALLDIGVVVERLAVLLELGLEEGRGAADEVFVDGKATIDVMDLEADDFATETVIH